MRCNLGPDGRSMSTSAPTTSIPSTSTGLLPNLAAYLQASAIQFNACIAEVTHTFTLTEPKATVHLQYVKFDPTSGEPKFDVLAKVLAKHVVRFTLSVSTRARMLAEMEV